MAEQTLETQLLEVVNEYIEGGNKIRSFIHGTAAETIESESGPKPTIAKIVKDTQDSLNDSMTILNDKVTQVSTDREAVEKIKTDTQTMLTSFENTHLPSLNNAISQNTQQINANSNAIAALPSIPTTGVGTITTGEGATNPSFCVNRNNFFSSITRINTGYYRFTFSTPQVDINYTTLVTIDWGTAWGAFKMCNQTTSSFEVAIISGNGGSGINIPDAKIHVLIMR